MWLLNQRCWSIWTSDLSCTWTGSDYPHTPLGQGVTQPVSFSLRTTGVYSSPLTWSRYHSRQRSSNHVTLRKGEVRAHRQLTEPHPVCPPLPKGQLCLPRALGRVNFWWNLKGLSAPFPWGHPGLQVLHSITVKSKRKSASKWPLCLLN